MPVLPVVSVTGLLIVAIVFVQPALPAPFPASAASPSGPYLAMEGGAVVGAAGPTDSAQPVSTSPSGYVLDDGAILASVTPVNGLSLTQDGLILYKVNKGDTVKSLAAKFGISSNTILWANHINKGTPLIVGQGLIILPVSGVLYEVQSGDTVSSISAAYDVSSSDIVPLMNGSESIQAGDVIVIENGKPQKNSSSGNNLPDLGNYLQSPIKGGMSTGILDSNNGANISAYCGAPIDASAEGLVTDEGDPSQSNGGLGGYIKLSHPLYGVQTIYAHTASNEVAVGDYVSQGEEIAKAGNTGTTNGLVGCDVYFEVVGAKNPLAE